MGCRRSAPPHHVVSPLARLIVMPRGTRRDASVHRRELPVALTRLCARSTATVLCLRTPPLRKDGTPPANEIPLPSLDAPSMATNAGTLPIHGRLSGIPLTGRSASPRAKGFGLRWGEQRQCKGKSWIPAFAGMTSESWDDERSWIPAFAGMTSRSGGDAAARAPLFVPGDATCRSWTGASPARGQ